jgi:hypothetical protein
MLISTIEESFMRIVSRNAKLTPAQVQDFQSHSMWLWGILGMLLCFGSLQAAVMDVSAQTSVGVLAGDTLSTAVPIWNFSINAGNFGLPQNPTSIQFMLVTLPVTSTAAFQATLSNGTESIQFSGPLYFIPGQFQGTFYEGAVSVLEGSVQFSEAFSQQLFSSATTLTLLNEGLDVIVGLAPYTTRQDLTISLGGSGLSVGAVEGQVFLDTPIETPEPSIWYLLLGSLLWVLPVGVRRLMKVSSKEYVYETRE